MKKKRSIHHEPILRLLFSNLKKIYFMIIYKDIKKKDLSPSRTDPSISGVVFFLPLMPYK